MTKRDGQVRSSQHQKDKPGPRRRRVGLLSSSQNDAETSVWTEEYFTAWSSPANKSHVETSDEPSAFHGRILQFKFETAAHCIETRRLPVCPLSLGCVRVARESVVTRQNLPITGHLE